MANEDEITNEDSSKEISNEVYWKNLASQYWFSIVIFGIIGIGAIIGFYLTVNWYIADQSIGGNGTWTFDQFSLKTGILWFIFLTIWVLLLVGVPTVVAAGFVAAVHWFVLFSTELKEEMKMRWKKEEEERKRRGRTDSGGAFSFLMFIGVCIYVYVDGNWSTEFGSLSLGYFVNAWLTVLIWGLIIFGIPAAIVGILWFLKKYGVDV